jgi:hypothetical protein
VVAKLKPAFNSFSQALPGLTMSFSILNELVNELAYNPGPNQGGFLFFADWLGHNFNSVYSSADSHGALGNTLAYSNCGLLSTLEPAARTDPAVKLLIGLFNFPHPAECPPLAGSTAGVAATARTARSASGNAGRGARVARMASANLAAIARRAGATQGTESEGRR